MATPLPSTSLLIRVKNQSLKHTTRLYQVAERGGSGRVHVEAEQESRAPTFQRLQVSQHFQLMLLHWNVLSPEGENGKVEPEEGARRHSGPRHTWHWRPLRQMVMTRCWYCTWFGLTVLTLWAISIAVRMVGTVVGARLLVVTAVGRLTTRSRRLLSDGVLAFLLVVHVHGLFPVRSLSALNSTSSLCGAQPPRGKSKTSQSLSSWQNI